MAGGNETPRQKMISLMYLVFISMLALNMGKEVLSAFGLMNEKLESSNSSESANNLMLLETLTNKAKDNPSQYRESKDKAVKIHDFTQVFYKHLEGVKQELTKSAMRGEDGKFVYDAMDSSAPIDELWFKGDGLSDNGKELLTTVENFKKNVKTVLGDDPKVKDIVKDIDKYFDVSDVKGKEGVMKSFLDFHFKGFPLIAAVSKLSMFQNDALVIEGKLYTTFTGGAAMAAASMKNYKTLVVMEKAAYFPGETVKGTVVLGRQDKSTVPSEVIINGSKLNLSSAMKDGQAQFSFNSGGLGEHKFVGKFIFMEDGKPIPIPVTGNYIVVARPNTATISADKMNVVYRGVPNPITISFSGVPSDKVSASAPGLRSAGKAGAYILEPKSGTEVVVNVTAKLPDGTFSDKKVFRIKSIPAPVGVVGGDAGIVKGPKSRLEVAQVAAILPDFDFDIKLKVVGFTLKVAGQPSVQVSGDRVESKCKQVLARVARGDQVTISDIQTKVIGSDVKLKETALVIWEIQ